MGLDELAPVVDAHQLAVHPDLDLLARTAEVVGHRVECIQALDVMVLMDGVGAPVGDLVGDAVPGDQGVAFLVLEDHQGLLAGGPVDAHPSHLQAPSGRGGADVG